MYLEKQRVVDKVNNIKHENVRKEHKNTGVYPIYVPTMKRNKLLVARWNAKNVNVKASEDSNNNVIFGKKC